MSEQTSHRPETVALEKLILHAIDISSQEDQREDVLDWYANALKFLSENNFISQVAGEIAAELRVNLAQLLAEEDESEFPDVSGSLADLYVWEVRAFIKEYRDLPRERVNDPGQLAHALSHVLSDVIDTPILDSRWLSPEQIDALISLLKIDGRKFSAPFPGKLDMRRRFQILFWEIFSGVQKGEDSVALFQQSTTTLSAEEVEKILDKQNLKPIFEDESPENLLRDYSLSIPFELIEVNDAMRRQYYAAVFAHTGEKNRFLPESVQRIYREVESAGSELETYKHFSPESLIALIQEIARRIRAFQEQ